MADENRTATDADATARGSSFQSMLWKSTSRASPCMSTMVPTYPARSPVVGAMISPTRHTRALIGCRRT